MVTEVRRPLIDETDFGAAIQASMVEAGDRFGLYTAMAESGPVLAAELAASTGAPWRYVRLWLEAQAAGDVLDYDEGTGRYSLWCAWPRRQAQGHSFRGDAVRNAA